MVRSRVVGGETCRPIMGMYFALRKIATALLDYKRGLWSARIRDWQIVRSGFHVESSLTSNQ